MATSPVLAAKSVAYGLHFCASGLIKRSDLTPGEMVGQVLLLNDLLREKNEMPISHVVVMGTGNL